MSHINERPTRATPRADRSSTAHSKTIAAAVAPEAFARAADAAGAFLNKLSRAADAAQAKGAL